jgi:hypothetical protein
MGREACLKLASDCLFAAKEASHPADRQDLMRAAAAWRELAELAGTKTTPHRRAALWNEPSVGRPQ